MKSGAGWMSHLQTSASNTLSILLTDGRLDRRVLSLCVLWKRISPLCTVSLFPHTACDSRNVNKDVDKIFYRRLNFSAIQYTVLLIKKKRRNASVWYVKI